MELSNSEVLAMFHGPHAYISPAWYTELQSVPTWNYMAVHVYGEARITTADELIDILQCTVQSFEQHRDKPWRMNSLPAEYIDNMARGIVGFEIDIQRIEGKFKLAQNRSQEDVLNVISELRLTGAAESAALAEAMSRYSG
jgi:transcriptional regulator